MPRFALGRLLLIAAILPPVIAALWYLGGVGKIHSGSEEKAAREKLLTYTPPGSSPKEVLSFVVNDLYRAGQVNAYHEYLRDYEASTGTQVNNITPTDYRTVEVIVSSWPDGLLSAHEVSATWHFDREDQLTDITTNSYSIGP